FRNGPKSFAYYFPLQPLIRTVEFFAKDGGQIEKVAQELKWLRQYVGMRQLKKLGERLDRALGVQPEVQIEPGEAWSDVALADLGRMKRRVRQAWDALLLHCQAGGRGKYSELWRTEAMPLLDAVGFDALKEHLLRWFPLVDKRRTQPRVPRHRYEPDYTELIIPEHVEL